MRVGLLADVHGNLVALDVVLAELDKAGVQHIVCLGDVAALGPQPRECVARLRESAIPCALGNTDDWLVAGAPAYTSAPVAELTRWAAQRLGPAEFEWLRRLPLSFELTLGAEQSLRCFHGSPKSHEDVIAAASDEARMDALLGDRQATIYAGGHTHVQLVRRFRTGWFINPGSVGLPGVGPGTPDLLVNSDVAWAEYAIVEAHDGDVAIELRRTTLDMPAVWGAVERAHMPQQAWWRGLWSSAAGD